MTRKRRSTHEKDNDSWWIRATNLRYYKFIPLGFSFAQVVTEIPDLDKQKPPLAYADLASQTKLLETVLRGDLTLSSLKTKEEKEAAEKKKLKVCSPSLCIL